MNEAAKPTHLKRAMPLFVGIEALGAVVGLAIWWATKDASWGAIVIAFSTVAAAVVYLRANKKDVEAAAAAKAGGSGQ